jgi:hypothetical protein
MIKDGSNTFIIFGPSEEQGHIIKRINREVEVLRVEDEKSLIETCNDLNKKINELGAAYL